MSRCQGTEVCAPNDTLAKLQAAPHANSDAARPLPRLTIALAEAICNGRDAVANESAEALQRRAKVSAVCQLQLVVGRRAHAWLALAPHGSGDTAMKYLYACSTRFFVVLTVA
jgi:hypothetical protein